MSRYVRARHGGQQCGEILGREMSGVPDDLGTFWQGFACSALLIEGKRRKPWCLMSLIALFVQPAKAPFCHERLPCLAPEVGEAKPRTAIMG